jgi:hypothetical protein
MLYGDFLVTANAYLGSKPLRSLCYSYAALYIAHASATAGNIVIKRTTDGATWNAVKTISDGSEAWDNVAMCADGSAKKLHLVATRASGQQYWVYNFATDTLAEVAGLPAGSNYHVCHDGSGLQVAYKSGYDILYSYYNEGLASWDAAVKIAQRENSYGCDLFDFRGSGSASFSKVALTQINSSINPRVEYREESSGTWPVVWETYIDGTGLGVVPYLTRHMSFVNDSFYSDNDYIKYYDKEDGTWAWYQKKISERNDVPGYAEVRGVALGLAGPGVPIMYCIHKINAGDYYGLGYFASWNNSDDDYDLSGPTDYYVLASSPSSGGISNIKMMAMPETDNAFAVVYYNPDDGLHVHFWGFVLADNKWTWASFMTSGES